MFCSHTHRCHKCVDCIIKIDSIQYYMYWSTSSRWFHVRWHDISMRHSWLRMDRTNQWHLGYSILWYIRANIPWHRVWFCCRRIYISTGYTLNLCAGVYGWQSGIMKNNFNLTHTNTLTHTHIQTKEKQNFSICLIFSDALSTSSRAILFSWDFPIDRFIIACL